MHACIDLGSNSFHLLIGEWKKDRIAIVERLSEKVQLGENVGSTGNISQQAYQRGMACLHRFKLLMRQYPIENYWALGTNTFRNAQNSSEFIKAAKKIGIEIAIITGVQEAILVYAGVISALPISESRRLVLDLGGGSTEVIVGEGHKRLITESLSVGSVAWRDRFFQVPSFSRAHLLSQMDKGAEEASRLFESVAPGVRRANWNEAYASSGTMKMLASICEEHGYGQKQITFEALKELKDKMADFVTTGKGLPGLRERRRDLLLPGWCIVTGLMLAYDISLLNFSATALREGMFDFLVKNKKTIETLQSGNLPEVSFAKH